MPETEEWMSVPAVAELLGLQQATVRAMIDRGELAAEFVLPYPRPKSRRRQFRIRRSDVDACIDAARIRPGSLRYLYEL